MYKWFIMTKKIDFFKNIAKWEAEKTLAQYARDHYSQVDDKHGKPKIAKVLDNVYHLAISAESEEVQLKASREIRETLAMGDPKEDKAPTQINFYQATSELINENAQKLIDISSKAVVKSGIEGII